MMIALILVVQTMMLFDVLQETKPDFDDLGTLLFAGVAAAIVLAVAFSIVRLKLREKNPAKSNFTTIGAPHERE